MPMTEKRSLEGLRSLPSGSLSNPNEIRSHVNPSKVKGPGPDCRRNSLGAPSGTPRYPTTTIRKKQDLGDDKDGGKSMQYKCWIENPIVLRGLGAGTIRSPNLRSPNLMH